MNALSTSARLALAAALFGIAPLGAADEAPRVARKLPVREVTVFKDGHAFVLHEGVVPADAEGDVVLDDLPAPVLGTFWPFATGGPAKLRAVVAGRRRVAVERTAMRLDQLIEANVGAAATFTEVSGHRYSGTILSVPTRGPGEVVASVDPGSPERPRERGSVVLIKTIEGTKVVSLDRIQDVTFADAAKGKIVEEEYRNLLTLRLDWPSGSDRKEAAVGMMYLQKGLRWIPSYRVTLDGRGKARVELEATLLDELADLDDVTVHLVIGVPTFDFKETLDPIALQNTLAQLSPYFQSGGRFSNALSNAIMSQAARMGEVRQPSGDGAADGDSGAAAIGAGKEEDLFIFTVEHVTLKKGERLVMPVTQFTLDYEDVYVLDVPLAPPGELRPQWNDRRQAELARLLSAPKVTHVARLVNSSAFPLTTAPALIVSGKRLLGQGTMTYTSVGGKTDLPITAAVDVKLERTDRETGRVPNAINWNGYGYTRIDLSGTLEITNYKDSPVRIEATRSVLGTVDSADHDGLVEGLNTLEDRCQLFGDRFPEWWSWIGWPDYWFQLNGVGRITWKATVEPGRSLELHYSWHRFWR